MLAVAVQCQCTGVPYQPNQTTQSVMNPTRLFVGNLSFQTMEQDLQDYFSQAGNVTSVNLMFDKFTGKSRGFAFVTMTTEADAQKAITEFNGKTVEGRPLTVNEARPREARPPGGGRSERCYSGWPSGP